MSIHFPEEEKKEKEEQEKFKRLMTENRDCLSILGDFAACYITSNPSTLLTKEWIEISIDILTSFWRSVDMKRPSWIDYFEEQRDAIDESSQKTVFELKSLFAKHNK